VSLEHGASASAEETSLPANEGASEDNLDPPHLDNLDPPHLDNLDLPRYVRASKDDVRRCSVAPIRIRNTRLIFLIT
jgi:hypothetical protein